MSACGRKLGSIQGLITSYNGDYRKRQSAHSRKVKQPRGRCSIAEPKPATMQVTNAAQWIDFDVKKQLNGGRTQGHSYGYL
jgi:hypothetical protein